MSDLPAVIPYKSVTASEGIYIHGQGGENFGGNVRIVGDVNGDGIDDLLISASTSTGAGAAYVVFGREGGFNAADFDVTTVDGTNGFKILGLPYNKLSYSGVSGGDFNGDGFVDLLLGAHDGAYSYGNHGGAVVIFGRETFTPVVSVSTLDGSDGFVLRGVQANSAVGSRAASAGDLDGDGQDDIAVDAAGAPGANAVYILFGAHTDNLASRDVQANGAQGVFIQSEAAADLAGTALAAAGDVNGDGRDDFLIGAKGRNSNEGAVYVLFGRDGAANPFGSSLLLSDLSATSQGMRITGEENRAFGTQVAAAGDVNGDGKDDIMVSASDRVYVLFGGAGFATDFSVAGLTADKGFVIAGDSSVGASLSGAGDLNADGYDDIIVGSRWSSLPMGTYSGAAFVIYGRASFGAGLNLLDGSATGVVRIQGAATWDWMGQGVSGGGDLNGDGVPDIVASSANLDWLNNSAAGGALVIYGPNPNAPIAFTGSAANDSQSGAGGADTLSGMGGNDVLYGLDGDDTLDGGDLSDLLYGGLGADDLVGGAGGDILYGQDGADGLSGGDGSDKLFGGAGMDLLNGGTGNDRMDGENDIDTLNGGAGNDYLDGGGGADIMSGGADNDVYIVDNVGDQTIELAGEGYDIVRTAVNGLSLADDVEALELQGVQNINGFGNGGANNLQGNSGANTLSGFAGVDTINGNDGDDIIIGGEGNDLLRGGLGADTFLVSLPFGPVLETDQVYDFSSAEGDIVDLSDAFAGTITKVDAFAKHAGEMTLTFAGGITTLRLDVTGDGKVDYQMKINGDVTGDWGGWLL